MNFVKWLTSLDELLYEVMTWLVFFPMTLWRTLRRPSRMMAYADSELHDPAEQQYDDTLSPPLFLFLALVVTHGVELALGTGDNAIIDRTTGFAAYIDNDTKLLILRLLIFSILPLIFSCRIIRAAKGPITRTSLRAPFYAQCYPAGIFALLLGVATTLGGTTLPGAFGALMALVAFGWYFAVQVMWFRRNLMAGYFRSITEASLGMLLAAAAAVLLAYLFATR